MARKADIANRLVDAALGLAAERGWRGLSMAEIAAAAKVPLAAALGAHASKAEILSAYGRRLDAAVIAGADAADLDQPVRDRLFDVIMRRFDAMKPQRAGLRRIARDLAREPGDLARAGCSLARTAAIMLEAAGIPAGGAGGLLRVNGLAAIYLDAFRVWCDDDSEDSAQTMARLDRRLSAADRIMARLCRRRRPREAAHAA